VFFLRINADKSECIYIYYIGTETNDWGLHEQAPSTEYQSSCTRAYTPSKITRKGQSANHKIITVIAATQEAKQHQGKRKKEKKKKRGGKKEKLTSTTAT
jgi:hypothetical protein